MLKEIYKEIRQTSGAPKIGTNSVKTENLVSRISGIHHKVANWRKDHVQSKDEKQILIKEVQSLTLCETIL